MGFAVGGVFFFYQGRRLSGIMRQENFIRDWGNKADTDATPMLLHASTALEEQQCVLRNPEVSMGYSSSANNRTQATLTPFALDQFSDLSRCTNVRKLST